VVLNPVSDGSIGTGPDDSIEMYTTTTPLPGEYVQGCSAVSNSFQGDIVIRSFFPTRTLWNVHAELTQVSDGQHLGCNSDAAYADLSATNGLWRYGTIGPKGSTVPGAPDTVTRTWKFKYDTTTAFTFRGRIVGMIGPEFEWTPTTVTTPTRSFVPTANTTGHFVWNGSTFEDRLGTGVTFTRTNGPLTGGSVGLTANPDEYATFASSTYYVATPATGASNINTSGDFTVCVKFKPGRHPGMQHNTKVLVGKGTGQVAVDKLPAVYNEGWSLMQMHEAYCFHYRTPLDPADNQTMSPVWPGDQNDGSDPATHPTQPETWAVDYLCGGRDGMNIQSSTHGITPGLVYGLNGYFANDAFLPLVIGADANGENQAGDAGVYEVIFDRRAATPAVMNEIVAAAEGRALPNAFGGAATWIPTFATSTRVVGADSNPYLLPPYLTAPYRLDGNGLLQAGQTVNYTWPLTEDTAATSGYCLGAELQANGAWWSGAPVVAGNVIQFGNQSAPGYATMYVNSAGQFGLIFNAFGMNTYFPIPGLSGWTSGSTHTFKVCVDPSTGTPSNAFFVDGVPIGSYPISGGTPFTLDNPSVFVGIGNIIPGGFPSPLTGAKVKRAFFCPHNNPALCL
jgi:hypothetical protein